MDNVKENGAKTGAPELDAMGNHKPVLKKSTKVRVAKIGDKRSFRLIILAKMFTDELLQKGTEVLQIIGQQYAALLKEAKISSDGLRAACEAGEVICEIAIMSTVKGQSYTSNDGVNSYIAGEKLVDVADGTELHRAYAVKFIVSAKGKQIAEAEDKKQNLIRRFERRNPLAAAQFLYGIGGGATANNAPAQTTEAPAAKDDEELGDEEM